MQLIRGCCCSDVKTLLPEISVNSAADLSEFSKRLRKGALFLRRSSCRPEWVSGCFHCLRSTRRTVFVERCEASVLSCRGTRLPLEAEKRE